MKTSLLIVLVSGVALGASAQQPAAAPASPPSTASAAGDVAKTASPELVGLLTKELGVSPKQAEGGAGALFGYAKTKMKADDYAKVAKAVPGVDGLVAAAPKADAADTKSSGGTLGALAGAAGSQLGGTAGAVAALTPAFQKLGLSGETVTKFVPIVVGFVTKKGGASTGDLLGAVLK